MKVLEEGRDVILNRVIMVGVIEKINLNKDLKKVMSRVTQLYGE